MEDKIDEILNPDIIDDFELPEWLVKQIKASIKNLLLEARIDEVNRQSFIVTMTERAMGNDSTIKLETLEASQKLRLAELQEMLK